MNKALILKLIKPNKSGLGFTLIELLVSIIIIGVLASIALPSFLGQVGKSRQAEAKTYLGTITRAQQAYYAEHNEFATNFKDLGVGIETKTNNYEYSTELIDDGKGAIAVAKPTPGATYKGYLGATAIVDAEINPVVATAICESVGTGAAATLDSSNVALGESEIVCTNGAVALR